MTFRERKELLIFLEDAEESSSSILELTVRLSKLSDENFSLLINNILRYKKISPSFRVLILEFSKCLRDERNIFISYLDSLDTNNESATMGTEMMNDKVFVYMRVKYILGKLLSDLGFNNTVKFIKYLIELN